MAKVFAYIKKRKELALTVADAFDILDKLPENSLLDLVYGKPNTLNREKIRPKEAIEFLTPIFRGKMPAQKVEVKYRGYPDRKGTYHFIDFTLNPQSWHFNSPMFEGPMPYRSVSVLYKEVGNN